MAHKLITTFAEEELQGEIWLAKLHQDIADRYGLERGGDPMPEDLNVGWRDTDTDTEHSPSGAEPGTSDNPSLNGGHPGGSGGSSLSHGGPSESGGPSRNQDETGGSEN